MQIKTWSNFSKRVNSTKQPLDSAATTKDVTLKDMCDILAPSFILNTTDFDINYVQAFGNYYFAQCINLDGHRTEIKCSLDHLATFKSQIGSYNGFINYAASAPASYIYIDDPRNTPTSEVKTASASTDPGWTLSTGGTIMLAMANAISNGNGGAPSYYILAPGDLTTVCSKIFDPVISTNIKNQFNDVFNCIVGCSWLPFSPTWVINQTGAVSLDVYAGNEDLGVNSSMLVNRIWKHRVYCPIPDPLGYNGTYIQSEKYISATIFLPGVGVCPISYDIFKESQVGICVDIYLDFITGDIVYYLSTSGPSDTGKQVVSYCGNVCAKVPVAGVSYDGIGVASGILTTAGGVASSVATGNIGAIGSGISQIVNSLKVQTMITGSNSSPLSMVHNSKIGVTVHQMIPVLGATSATELEEFRAEQGMPYFKKATVSSLSGYIQFRDASVSIPGDGAEQDVVNNYLNAGFYYE